MSLDSDTNGWGEWRRHVLITLEQVDQKVMALDGKVTSMQTDIALLKLKSRMWGALAGAVGGTVFGGIITYVVNHL